MVWCKRPVCSALSFAFSVWFLALPVNSQAANSSARIKITKSSLFPSAGKKLNTLPLYCNFTPNTPVLGTVASVRSTSVVTVKQGTKTVRKRKTIITKYFSPLTAAQRAIAKKKKLLNRCLLIPDPRGLGGANCTLLPVNVALTVPQAGSAPIGTFGQDSCGRSLNLLPVSGPAHGRIELVDGTLSYVATGNYTGSDSVSFRIGAATDQSSGTGVITITVVPCIPQATASISLSVGENELTPLTGLGSDSCNKPLSLVRFTDPQNGVLQDGAAPTYKPNLHYLGSDSLQFKVSNGIVTSANTGSVTITVSAELAEFAGDPTSLGEYRNHLTPREVAGLLKRVALGGNDALYQFGLTHTRAEFVDALLAERATPAVEARSKQEGDASGYLRPPNYYPEVLGGNPIWYGYTLRSAWGVHLLKGAALHEVALLHLHDHFATNVQVVLSPDQVGFAYAMREHYLKLRNAALGSADDFLSSLNYDAAMGWSLDNRNNQYDATHTGNFNFGREMLERFTLGRFNPYNGQPNYREEDVNASSKLLSGFESWFSSYSPQPGTGNWNRDVNTGQVLLGMGMQFFQNLAYSSPVRIFGDLGTSPANREFTVQEDPSKPGRSATADQLVHLLLYDHPAAARHIAYSFFGRFAYPHPTEAMADELAVLLRTNHYDMTTMLRRVLNSSAMFTPDAMQGCIKSPIEHLAYAIRTLALPMNTHQSFALFQQAMDASGMAAFEPGSVFGWKICGDLEQPGVVNHGEAWLSSQLLLNRGRYLGTILDQQVNDEHADLRTTFGPWNNPTADEVVSRGAQRFNLVLSAAERTILVNHLNQGSDGTAWDPNQPAKVAERLRDLAWVLAMHPKSML